jgi:hypothetical protein
MRLRLRPPPPPAPVEHPRAASVVDVAWDRSVKAWRGFSDDCGAFSCFVSPEFVKAKFPYKYADLAQGYVCPPIPEAMTQQEREARFKSALKQATK